MNFFKFYKGKKVLITGHTGFKGSWLTLWLNQLGADVVGISLDPKYEYDNFNLCELSNKIKDYRADIRNIETVKEIIEFEKPEILFHLAAQPIVIDSYSDPVYNFETNILGTVNLLENFRISKSLKIGIFVTSDKCYENNEKDYSYRESDPMGGHDPYSASKGAAELVISSYRRSFFYNNDKKISSVRAGNVIGGGDWSSHRLVVDIIKGITNNKKIKIRNPKAIRPWQHVLEPLGGYLKLAAKMYHNDDYNSGWNFGPEKTNIVTVQEIVSKMIEAFGKGEWIDISNREKFHEAKLLSLDIAKAKKMLEWQPLLDLNTTVKLTAEWYKNFEHNALQTCIKQIKQYQKMIENHG